MAKKIIVIGGSAAGPKAAARARRLDLDAEITIIQKDPDLSMASCGYPYFVGGTFEDRNQLLATPTGVVRDPGFFERAKGIVAKVETEVTGIDRQAGKVACRNLRTGQEESLSYDKLIVATGAVPRIPPLPGKELKGITTLQSMKDADFLKKVREEGTVKKAVIIGGGLIGIETCEALQLAGIQITVVEMLPQILKFLDWDLAKILENHVRSKASNVLTDVGVTEFLGQDGVLTGVKLSNGAELPCELAVMAIGVAPNTKLAQEAGLEIGETRGIRVDEHMQTSDPNIYAVGDCVETVNRITGKKALAPYGDLANLQGRVAGENAVLGNTASFPGTIHTGICQVFDYNAGATGLSETTARELGLDVTASVNASLDKPGFMSGKLLISKLVADSKTGRILGYQCVGPGDVGRQIAQAAMAIMGGMTVTDVSNADLPYAPPFSLALDHFIASAHVLDNKMRGLYNGLSCVEVHEKLEAGEKPFLLDVRDPVEYEQLRIGLGEMLMPMGRLRDRLGDLPEDKDQEIICYCKISLRGYEAARLLQARGWTNVKVMEGGVMAWPYAREK